MKKNNKAFLSIDLGIGLFIGAVALFSLYMLPNKLLKDSKLLTGKMVYISETVNIDKHIKEDIRSFPNDFTLKGDTLRIGDVRYIFNDGVSRITGSDNVRISNSETTPKIIGNTLLIFDEFGNESTYNLALSSIPVESEGENVE